MRMRLPGALIVAAISIAYGVAAADDAKTLYDKKCAACHTLKGQAGKFADKGGPLDGVGSKRDEAWLRAYFADPKSKIPDAKMPKMKLSPAEWDTLVSYMLSLK
jgi:mono/diheme cytochrome c family protein